MSWIVCYGRYRNNLLVNIRGMIEVNFNFVVTKIQVMNIFNTGLKVPILLRFYTLLMLISQKQKQKRRSTGLGLTDLVYVLIS